METRTGKAMTKDTERSQTPISDRLIAKLKGWANGKPIRFGHIRASATHIETQRNRILLLERELAEAKQELEQMREYKRKWINKHGIETMFNSLKQAEQRLAKCEKVLKRVKYYMQSDEYSVSAKCSLMLDIDASIAQEKK